MTDMTFDELNRLKDDFERHASVIVYAHSTENGPTASERACAQPKIRILLHSRGILLEDPLTSKEQFEADENPIAYIRDSDPEAGSVDIPFENIYFIQIRERESGELRGSWMRLHRGVLIWKKA